MILPGRVEIREQILATLDEDWRRTPMPWGNRGSCLRPGTSPGRYAELILAARRAKARPLESFLDQEEAGDELRTEAGPALP